jgi:hypothetical protein
MPARPLPTSPDRKEQNRNAGIRKLAVKLEGVTDARIAVLLTPLAVGGAGAGAAAAPLPAVRPLAEWGRSPRAGAVVPLWGRWEAEFTADAPTGGDAVFPLTLTAPDGGTREIDGFWDGGRVWRVRFSPDQEGVWHYRIGGGEIGPAPEMGSFEVRRSDSENRFLAHGPVRVSVNGRYLAHADGTPFFWLADTGWNGALKSTPEGWATYMADRKSKDFSVVQLVTTQWRAAHANAEGQVAYTGFRDIRIDPTFFGRMDARMDALDRAGILAAPVLLWTLGDSLTSPGKLPEDQAIRLARYLVARYQGNHVVWILAGDENYEKTAERWKRIGRAVFDSPGHAPVTLHPQGMRWDFAAFENETWLDFLIYQSGHGDDANTVRWIHSGPVSSAWRTERPRPIINAEPPYEDHVAYQSHKPQSAYNVRRAAYWSLLAAPTAGVSYGAHGVWSWETEPGVPLEHPSSGIAKPWFEAIRLPGSTQMEYLAELFTSLDWWRLRPAPDLVASQPADPMRFVGSAETDGGDLAVLYLPVGGTVRLTRAIAGGATWYDPRTSAVARAVPVGGNTFTAPDARDWVLVLGARCHGQGRPGVPCE